MWHSQDFIVVQAGGAGTGKTRGALEKLNYAMLRWPGARGLILRKTRASLTNTGLVTFEEDVLPVGSSICKGAKRDSRSNYHYPARDGLVSEIVCGGMASSGDEKQRVMSSQYDIVIMIEMTEFDEDDLQKLTTRMRNFKCQRPDGSYFTQILGDCNPSGPNHWIKRWEASKRLKLLESRHEDNPAYFDQEKREWTPKGKSYMATLDALTGVAYDRLRLGKWVQAEGIVYPEFDRKVHLIDRFEIPASWRRIRAIDFGYTNAFVCLWIAIDHDGRMYVYRELYHTGRTVRVHAEQIKKLSEGEKIDYTVADHDAEDRATLRECGIGTIPAKKEILRGIKAVRERLKVRGDGKPRLFILRDSLVERDQDLWDKKRPCCWLDEFDAYVWPKSQEGRPIKELPVDDNDHACFVWETKIMTSEGQVPILFVRPGDSVLTRNGYRRVLESGMTQRFSPIVRVDFSDGSHLEGTGNHPVWVQGKGFTRLDSLRYGDTIESVKDSMFSSSEQSWERRTEMSLVLPSASCSMGLSFGDIPTQKTGATAPTFTPITAFASTGLYGSATMGQSQMGTMSTTRTKTRSTTTSAIWSVLRSPSTTQSTPRPCPRKESSNFGNWLIGFAHSVSRGTDRLKGWLGIGSTRKFSGKTENHAHSPASDAENNSRRSSPRRDFVPTPARLRTAETLESMTSIDLARSAARLSGSTGTENRGSAPVSVLGIRATGEKRPVWNLSVEDDHEYYANGVLVSNCDSVRYAVMALDYQKPPIEPDTPEVAKAKVVADEDRAKRLQQEHLWKYGWNSF